MKNPFPYRIQTHKTFFLHLLLVLVTFEQTVVEQTVVEQTVVEQTGVEQTGVEIDGCMDSTAINYDSSATISTVNECEFPIEILNTDMPIEGTTTAKQNFQWYSFILKDHVDNLSGSIFDTILDVYSGSYDTNIGTNDDYDGIQSQINLSDLSPGIYFVKVYGYMDAVGDYTLTIYIPGLSCEFPIVILNTDMPIVGTTTSEQKFQWYSFNLNHDFANPVSLSVSLSGSTFDTKLDVYFGSCDIPPIKTNDDYDGLQSQINLYIIK